MLKKKKTKPKTKKPLLLVDFCYFVLPVKNLSSLSLHISSPVLQWVCFSSFNEETGLGVTLVALSAISFCTFVYFLLKTKWRLFSLIFIPRFLLPVCIMTEREACSNDVCLLGKWYDWFSHLKISCQYAFLDSQENLCTCRNLCLVY